VDFGDKMIYELFGTMPRTFGKRRLPVDSWWKFIRLINEYNRLIQCYGSIYTSDNNKTIDKIFFDTDIQRLDIMKGGDNAPRCQVVAQKIHEWCMKYDYRHTMLYSGNGFHIYVFTTQDELKSRKNAIEGSQLFVAKELDLTVGESKTHDLDSKVISDASRIAGIPHTLNINGNRYRIPITKEQLYLSIEEIKKLASKQQFIKPIYGSVLFDIKEFDTKTSNRVSKIKLEDIDVDVSKDIQIYMNMLPPLFQKLLKNCKCAWRDRYHTIFCFRECGFPISIGIKVAQQFWTQEKFKHSVFEEDAFRDIYYNRQHIKMANWDTLKMEGYPVTDKDREFKFYKR